MKATARTLQANISDETILLVDNNIPITKYSVLLLQ